MNEYEALCWAIANQAEALAKGTHTGPRHAVVALMAQNVETLKAWTQDDRK